MRSSATVELPLGSPRVPPIENAPRGERNDEREVRGGSGDSPVVLPDEAEVLRSCSRYRRGRSTRVEAPPTCTKRDRLQCSMLQPDRVRR